MDDVDDDDWKVGIGGMLFVGWASLEIVEGGWFAWKVGLVLLVWCSSSLVSWKGREALEVLSRSWKLPL